MYWKTKGLSNAGTLTTRHQDSLVAIVGSQPDSPLVLKKAVSNTPGRSAFGPKKTIRMQGFSQHASVASENRSLVGLEPASPLTRFSRGASRVDLSQKNEWNEDEPNYKPSDSVVDSQYRITAIMDSPQTPMRRLDTSSLMLSPALAKFRSQQSKLAEKTPQNNMQTPTSKVEASPMMHAKIANENSPEATQNKISPFMTPKVSVSGRGTLHQVKAVVRFKTLVIGEADSAGPQPPEKVQVQAKNDQGFGRWAKSAMKKHPLP